MDDSIRTRTITITLTQACNLACTYCYEHNKSGKKIDIDVAKKIIDRELNDREGCDAFEFDLFGGEPFLAFDELKEITEYICENKGDIPCTVFATTNGTLVHGEIQEWLRKYSECFICGLSLDGTREMHNLNRSNSYDDIDLDFFLDMYPQQDVKMTISQETLPDLAEGVIDLHNKGFLVSCNLAFEIDWSNPDNANILYRELNELIDFYLNHPNIEPCSMLSMGISNIGVDNNDAVRYCGAGIYIRSYDVDGRCYPCQFFMPLSIGEEKASKVKDIQFPEDTLPENELDEKCRKCVARAACPNCFGANYANSGSIYKRDDNMCRLTKIILKARSYFLAKKWELNMLDEDDETLPAILNAIIRIQEELDI